MVTLLGQLRICVFLYTVNTGKTLGYLLSSKLVEIASISVPQLLMYTQIQPLGHKEKPNRRRVRVSPLEIRCNWTHSKGDMAKNVSNVFGPKSDKLG